MSECTKEIGILRATTNNHQASCFRQDNQERPQTHKHTLYSLTRRLYRVGALGSRHTEMWRDKCEILESMFYYSWTFIWPCVCVTYRPLVRVEVVGEAAHVGGGWRAQALRVEEWWQWRPAATLRTLLLLVLLLSAGLRSEMLSHPLPLSPPPDSLWSPRNSIWIWSGCWRLQPVNNLTATKVNMHK